MPDDPRDEASRQGDLPRARPVPKARPVVRSVSKTSSKPPSRSTARSAPGTRNSRRPGGSRPRRPAGSTKVGSRRKRNDDDDDYEYEAPEDNKQKQMLIIGGVVSGVILLVILIFLAMPSGRKKSPRTRKKGNNHQAMYDKARQLHSDGGKLQYEFEGAKADGKKTLAISKWGQANTCYMEARELYDTLWRIYGPKGDYTGLEENIRLLNESIHDLQKGMIIDLGD